MTSAIITCALIGSVVLLVMALPAHKEAPLALLVSGAELWVSNVLVFALAVGVWVSATNAAGSPRL